MASNKSRIEVEIVAEDNASDEIKQVAEQAQTLEGESVKLEIDADVSKVLSAFDDVAAEAKATAKAAEVLSKALGPELAAKADASAIVNDLKQMGLTLDQITSNADQLGAKLRNLSDADVGGRLGSTLGTARGKLDDLGKSAGSSKAVLANMVGNSVQDLGQLGGVAGSAGVAIGQMGEYMADAAASGEGLGSILASFATVAGPVAALSIGMGLVTKAMDDIRKNNEAIAKSSEDMAEAISSSFREIEVPAEVTDLAEAITDSFLKTQETAGRTSVALDTLGISAENLGRVLIQLDDGARRQWFEDFLNASEKVTGVTDDIAYAVSVAIANEENFADIVTQAFNLGGQAAEDFINNNKEVILGLEQLNDAAEDIDINKVVQETADALRNAQGGTEAWLAALKELHAEGIIDPDQQAVLERALFIYNSLPAVTERWILANKPMSDMAAQWDTVANAAHGLLKGQALSAEAQELVNSLMKEYGISSTEVLNRANNLWDDNQSAAEEAAKKTKDAADAQAELSQRVGETNLSLRDLAHNLDDIEMGALAEALDPGDAALDALGALQDLNKEARDFGDWLHEPESKVKDLGKDLAAAQKELAGIDPADAKEVASQLSKIRDIQSEILDARKKVTGTPNIFDLGDPKSADFLRKFAPIRDDASKGLEDAFAQGGMDGAKAFADNMIRTLSQETGLRPEEIIGLLGWQDLTVTLKVAIDLSDAEKAKEQLGFLEDLLGPNATQKQRADIFNIRMGLSTDTITGKEAQAAIQQMMLQVPNVQLPVELALPDLQELLRSYQEKMNANPLRLSVVPYAPAAGVPGAAGTTTIINNYPPPGVQPTAVAQAGKIYVDRNGSRLGPQ